MWMKTSEIPLGMGWEKLDPAPDVSRGDSWPESSEIFHGICAPGAAGNLWKRTFLLEKKIPGTSLDSKGISGNPELLFPLFFPKEKCGF